MHLEDLPERDHHVRLYDLHRGSRCGMPCGALGSPRLLCLTARRLLARPAEIGPFDLVLSDLHWRPASLLHRLSDRSLTAPCAPAKHELRTLPFQGVQRKLNRCRSIPRFKGPPKVQEIEDLVKIQGIRTTKIRFRRTATPAADELTVRARSAAAASDSRRPQSSAR